MTDWIPPDAPKEEVWTPPDPPREGSFLLRGITRVTDIPAQIFGDIVIGAEGRPFVEAIGPEEVRRRRQAGIPPLPGVAMREPTSLFERGAELAGETLPFGVGLGVGAGFVRPAPSITGRVFGKDAGPLLERGRVAINKMAVAPQRVVSEMGETFFRSPLMTTGLEVASGFTAGAGGYLASDMFPDSDYAQLTGEVIGSFGPAAIPRSVLIRAGNTVRNRIMHPMTARGGRERAIARVGRTGPVVQREEALRQLEEPTTIDPETGEPILTVTQRTEQSGPLALERSIIESSDMLTHESHVQIARANEVIQESLEDIGGEVSFAARAPLEEQIALFDHLVDTRIKIAAQRVDERIRAMGPDATVEELNRIATQELLSADAAARAQKNQLFDVIDQESAVPFENVEGVFNAFLGRGSVPGVTKLGHPQRRDMPSIARQYLSEGSDQHFNKLRPEEFEEGLTTVADLRALQSQLWNVWENSSLAGKGRNPNRARIAKRLIDAIDADLENMEAGPDAVEDLNRAIEFTHLMKQRFNEGPVGKILGRVSAAPAVPAGLTLDKSLGLRGGEAREAFDGLIRAFDSPEAPSSLPILGASHDYMRAKFLEKAVKNGEVNVRAAEDFLVRHKELLSRMPQIVSEIDEVVRTGNKLAMAARRKATAKIQDPRASKAAMYIDKGPVDTFRSIAEMGPAKARQETAKLIRKVSRDETGEALEGLKTGFIETLTSRAFSQRRDVFGMRFLSGNSLSDALNQPSMKAMATELLSPEELDRLNVLIKDLRRIEFARRAAPSKEGVIGDAPGKASEMVARMVGVKIGHQQSLVTGTGGNIQLPAMWSQRMKELLDAGVQDPAKRLIRDSILDEALFKELMQASLEETSEELMMRASRRLNAWAFAVLAEHGGVIGDENSAE